MPAGSRRYSSRSPVANAPPDPLALFHALRPLIPASAYRCPVDARRMLHLQRRERFELERPSRSCDGKIFEFVFRAALILFVGHSVSRRSIEFVSRARST